jgi:hypothetical protein
LNLYEESFAGRDVSLDEFRPLVHVMFGGLGGIYLKNLVRISVVVSKAAVVGIDFYYSGEGAPPAKCIQACPSMSTADDNWFSIDGPAGERLTGIQADSEAGFGVLGSSSAYKNGFISSLKVS